MAQELSEAAELLLAENPSPEQFTAALAGGDVNDLVQRALDPADPRLTVIGWPGQRLRADLQRGDLVLRGAGARGAARRLAVIADPQLLDQRQARAAALMTGPAPGRFVRTLEPGAAGGAPVFARRVLGPDGLVLSELMVLRGLGPDEAVPLTPRPMIRFGSSGPAVAEAQSLLNTVHAKRIGQGQSGIQRCPLAVDGRFGPNTRSATHSFQRIAFPEAPNEWDGIIGPKTWAMLDLHARSDTPDIPRVDPPIIPIVFRPLDPPRWGPLLRRASSRPIRAQNAVKALIDGPQTYRAMLADLRRATNERSFIYLLGWDCYDNFPLDPGASPPCGTSLNQVLSDAVAAGAQVRVMLWRNIFEPFAISDVAARFNALSGPAGNGACIVDSRHGGAGQIDPRAARAVLAAIAPMLETLADIPGIGKDFKKLRDKLAKDIERAARAQIAAHHQKVLIVFDGEQLVAYCGGLDFHPNRTITSTNCLPGTRPGDINPPDPQHDTHCRIIGPAALDLLETFVDRWLDHPEHGDIDRTKTPLRGARGIAAPPVPNPAPADSETGASVSVVIARTYNPPAGGAIPRQRDIASLLLAAVAGAESFIYFEDQYLWNFDTSPGATLALASALNARLPYLRHVTAVIPANAISDPGLFQRVWRKRFIDVVRGSHPPDIADRFQVYQPNRGACGDDGCLGAHTYVHSKCWVFDDELAVIGSANCNRRGYQHDSEVDAFIFDDVAPGGGGAGPLIALAATAPRESIATPPSFAQSFRRRLWREHLGISVADGADNSAWPSGSAPVGNVVRFKVDRPLIVNALVDPFAFPIVARIAETARGFWDPSAP
ncbi:MAG: hypothetical protein K2X76_02460 [Sphingomonas sp.]|nr:hypothetical protein [Sphingomonas sp.]